MTSKQKNTLAFVLFAVFLSIIGIVYWYNGRTFETGKTTTGILWTDGRIYRWQYKVNGWRYTGTMGVRGNSHLFPGEEYVVYYESGKPNHSVIDLSHPVIDPAAFAQTISRPCTQKLMKGNQLISFTYNVSGIDYHRRHGYFFPEEFDGKGMAYKVLYKKSDPRIAYIDVSAPSGRK